MVTARLGIRHKHNDNKFSIGSRSAKEFIVRECERSEWAKFRRYHYLNTEIATASVCYGLYDKNNIIGFMAVLHQPHGANKKIKRVSRLVILPDYQGIGLGTKFLNVIAEYYKSKGYDFTIVTSAKNMIHALRKSPKWIMTRYSANGCSSPKSTIDFNRKSIRSDCKTGGFKYR